MDIFRSKKQLTKIFISDCEKFPLLFVDVNLGYGKSDRIVVFDGDKSEVLAKNFATLHGNFGLLSFQSSHMHSHRIGCCYRIKIQRAA